MAGGVKVILPALYSQPVCHLVRDALSPASSAHAQCHLADCRACPTTWGLAKP